MRAGHSTYYSAGSVHYNQIPVAAEATLGWTPEEINDGLTAAGFTEVQIWDATPFCKGDGMTVEGCRSFVLARKRRQARR